MWKNVLMELAELLFPFQSVSYSTLVQFCLVKALFEGQAFRGL